MSYSPSNEEGLVLYNLKTILVSVTTHLLVLSDLCALWLLFLDPRPGESMC